MIQTSYFVSVFVTKPWFGTKIGTESCEFSLVLVPNTEILVL